MPNLTADFEKSCRASLVLCGSSEWTLQGSNEAHDDKDAEFFSKNSPKYFFSLLTVACINHFTFSKPDNRQYAVLICFALPIRLNSDRNSLECLDRNP